MAQDQSKQMETALHSVRKENEKHYTLQSKEKEVKLQSKVCVPKFDELEVALKETTEQLKNKENVEIKKERAVKDRETGVFRDVAERD